MRYIPDKFTFGVHKVDPNTHAPQTQHGQHGQQDDIYSLPLSSAEMALRDRFVVEYLVDYDPFKAAIRLGYSPAFARSFSIQFMNEPYVLNKIKESEIGPEVEFDEVEQKKKIVNTLWREANFYGMGSSQSARVAALAKLSAFYGMDAPSRSTQELTGKDGEPLGQGVFVIPGLVSAEDWAKQAEEQQANLIKPELTPGQLKIA